MTNPATTALVISKPLLPVVHVDVHAGAQLPAVTRPYSATYQRAIDAVVVSTKEVDQYVSKAGPHAEGSRVAAWVHAHESAVGSSGVLGTFVGGLVGLLACIGAGHMGPGEILVAEAAFATAAVSLPTWIYAAMSGGLLDRSKVKAQTRRLTTKDAASFLKRVRDLDPDERSALKPALTTMLARLKGTLSSKAYGEANALLESATAPANDVERRAAIVAAFVADSLAGNRGSDVSLRQAINDAEPDERRAIAAVLENALFVGEQQRAHFPDPDGLYVIITKAAEGLSPLEKQS